jgi:hypothetical protein
MSPKEWMEPEMRDGIDRDGAVSRIRTQGGSRMTGEGMIGRTVLEVKLRLVVSRCGAGRSAVPMGKVASPVEQSSWSMTGRVGHGVFSRRGQETCVVILCGVVLLGSCSARCGAVPTRERGKLRKPKVVVGLNSAKSKNRVARLWWRVDAVRRVGSARKSRVQKFVSLFEMVIDGCGWGWRFF